MITLFPEQEQDKEDIRASFRQGFRRVAGQAATGYGKALPAYAPILTPSGWQAIGHLRVGDEVVGADGRPTLVEGVYVQGIQDVACLVLRDGIVVRCSWDHLWSVRDKHTTRWRLITTSELRELTRQRPNVAWRIPLMQPIEMPEQAYDLDPYLMGVLLGDGCLSISGTPRLSTSAEVAELASAALPAGVHLSGRPAPRAYLLGGRMGCSSNPARTAIDMLGLAGCKAADKFIPDSYRSGSVEQRKALLAGLLDTDGYVNGSQIEYSTASQELAVHTTELVRGLGGTARLASRESSYTYRGERRSRPSFRLAIKLPWCPFRRESKRVRWRPPQTVIRGIDRVEATTERAQMVCIKVAAPDGLFVTIGHAVTHNTIVFASMMKDAHDKGNASLALVHRDELVQQTCEKIRMIAPELGESIGIVKADQDEWDKQIVIASVQTLGRDARLQRILNAEHRFPLIICDECHHAVEGSQYDKIFTAFGAYEDGSRVAGFSATLERADSKSLGAVWETVAFRHDILELIRKGRLCDVRAYSIGLQIDFSDLHVRGGDYDAEEAAQLLHNAHAPHHTVNAWLRHAHDRKTIVFTPTVDSACEMRDRFRLAGVTGEMVSGETPLEERRDLLARFREGDVQVICNCAVLVEGFDEPSANCIVMARPTRSHPFFVQCVGRGLRIWPGKQDCLVMDMVGATNRLDLMTTIKLFSTAAESEEDVAEALEGEGLFNLLERREQEKVQQGRIISKQVDIFGRKNMSWQMRVPGEWVLGLGEAGDLLVKVGADNRWSVRRIYMVDGYYAKQPRIETLEDNLDLGYAMGVAEQYARKNGAAKLVDKGAAWRQKSMSQPQLEQFAKWKWDPNGLTRGEASDMITAEITRRRLRRLVKS